MLPDIYMLEEFYDHPECAAFFEDLSERYGPGVVHNAVVAGHIRLKRIMCGGQKGRLLCTLTDKGRTIVQSLQVA